MRVLNTSEEHMAEAIKAQVMGGGLRAEVAAAIARHFMNLERYRDELTGFTRVNFFTAAGLTVDGEVK